MATLDFSRAEWRKSTRSGSSGGACVEVAFVPAEQVWRKSTRSSSSGGQCVEVAFGRGAVGMRDSKDHAGPVLAVEPGAWSSFISGVRSGDFG